MYALIMAGGVGKRFWPMSRSDKPKQFLNLYGDKSMLQMTLDRLKTTVKPENVLVITNKDHLSISRTSLPELPPENVIAEPFGKDTAPCICLGALAAVSQDPEAVMVVLPADHLIKDMEEFRRIINLGAELADEHNCLITIGIEPDRPETGYGYIQFDEEETDNKLPEKFKGKGIWKVKAFAEKPNLASAKRFMDSGDFLWNSGIFIWKAKTILEEIEDSLPDLFDSMLNVEGHFGKPDFDKKLLKAYKEIRSISIDYGIMEKARNVYVIKGNLGWSDVGSWEEYYRLHQKDREGNVTVGVSEMLDSNNNLIISDDKLVAAIGVDDLVVVNSNNVILICPRNRTQDIKQMVDYLVEKDTKRFL